MLPSARGAHPSTLPRAQSCPGEWVYHYVDTSTLGGGHYGSGHHLRYSMIKTYGEGSSFAVTRHLSAPIKVVPPYVTLGGGADNVSTVMYVLPSPPPHASHFP